MNQETRAVSPQTVLPGTKPFGHIIDGITVPAATGKTFASLNPATGTEIAQLAEGSAEDVDRAVAAARRAFEGPWSKWSPTKRQALLMRIAQLLDERFDEFAMIETLDMGAPLARTKMLREPIRQMIMFFASQALAVKGETLQNSLPLNIHSMTIKAPVGVVAGIIPWNGPLISQWWVLGGALATGCTAVMKPAEDASLSMLKMVELLHEAGMPEGVVNVVTGYGHVVGEALSRHPGVDRIAFTGSTATGKRIVEASTVGMKKLQLELGGKSPDIIFADADLDKAVPGAAMGVFTNSGQVCYAGSRVFVQRKIQDEFVERLTTFTEAIKVGNGLDPDVQLGPLISQKQLDRVMGYIDGAPGQGARLAAGGKRLEGDLAGGYFVTPTVFSGVSNDMTIAREEIFGPVISVIPFDDAEDALRMANDTEYGLGGAVWTRDVATMYRMIHGIRTGTLWVNCYGAVDPAVGFGGIKNSGYGVKGGAEHLDLYLYRKAVYVNMG